MGPPPTKSRHGLLTPEASGLVESQTEPQTESPKAADTVSPRDKDIFPFLELPAEIRLHVYYMALVRPEPILLHVQRAPGKVEEEPDEPSSTANEQRDLTEEDSSTPDHLTSRARTLRDNFLAHPSNSQLLSRRTLRNSSPDPCPTVVAASSGPSRNDPILPVLLRLNSQINKEARQLLYSENVFTLSLSSGIHTLSTLHQRSRSLIKHMVLTIPSHHDILDGFADLVRLGLRYCWGLKSFRIILEAALPDTSNTAAVGTATSVYANAFHILRWLPRGCSVVLEGEVSDQVRRVVSEEGRLMNVLDERSYLKRQHQMPERH